MGLLDKLVRDGVGRGQEKDEIRDAIHESGGRVLFDIDGDFDLGGFQEGGGPEESEGSDSSTSGAPPEGYLAWGQLQQEILDAFIADEDEVGGPVMTDLARRLRSGLDDLMEVLDRTDPKVWAAKRLNRLLQAERIRNRDINWDVLEDAVLQKLMGVVETSKIIKTSELLAIAQVANRANRRSIPMHNNNGGNTFIQVNNGGAGGVQLPGPGGLGTMRLTLSARTVNQLGSGITIDASAEKFTDSIEMLGGDDVSMLSKLADER